MNPTTLFLLCLSPEIAASAFAVVLVVILTVAEQRDHGRTKNAPRLP